MLKAPVVQYMLKDRLLHGLPRGPETSNKATETIQGEFGAIQFVLYGQSNNGHDVGECRRGLEPGDQQSGHDPGHRNHSRREEAAQVADAVGWDQSVAARALGVPSAPAPALHGVGSAVEPARLDMQPRGCWIDHYDQPRVRTRGPQASIGEANDAKAHIRRNTTYIQTTPETLWQALTEPAFTKRYWDVTFETDWTVGSTMVWDNHGAIIADPGQVVLE